MFKDVGKVKELTKTIVKCVNYYLLCLPYKLHVSFYVHVLFTPKQK